MAFRGYEQNLYGNNNMRRTGNGRYSPTPAPRYVAPARRNFDAPIRPDSSASNRSSYTHLGRRGGGAPLTQGYDGAYNAGPMGMSANGGYSYGRNQLYMNPEDPFTGTANAHGPQLNRMQPMTPAYDQGHGYGTPFMGHDNSFGGGAATAQHDSQGDTVDVPVDSPQGGRPAALAALIMTGATSDGLEVEAGARPRRAMVEVDRRQTMADYNYNPSPYETPRRRNRTNTSGYAGRHHNSTLTGMHESPYHQRAIEGPREYTEFGRVLPPITSPPPGWLAQTMQGYKPSLKEALGALPFASPLALLKPQTYGVIKFLNIPYNTTKNELLACLGRNAQVAPMATGTPYFAVHIIMDRNTGKTMDAFIEVKGSQEAVTIVNSFTRRMAQGRQLRIGERLVDVELSSQEALMDSLFPRAKFVTWAGSVPTVNTDGDTYFIGQPAIGFDGFVGSEEMVMLVKYADMPSRSPFAARSPNRIYECAISTIHKYPWYAPEVCILSDRKKVFDATLSCIRSLAYTLRRGGAIHENLTPRLLHELSIAALGCPGFSEQQKNFVVNSLIGTGYGAIATGSGVMVPLGGNTPLSASWPFLALAAKQSAPKEVLEYYVKLIAETTSDNSHLTLGQLAAIMSLNDSSDPHATPFGDLEVDYGTDNMGRLSLAEVAQKEFDALAAVLQKALGGSVGSITSSSSNSTHSG